MSRSLRPSASGGCALVVGLLLGALTLQPGCGAVAAAAPAKPARIVSMNLCIDQLLLLLVEPERIASLSFLSADPATSAMAEEAGLHVLNHGLAEEILPLAPDLVLAGSYTSQPTVGLLRRFDFRVVELPLALTLGDIGTQIRAVAEAVGEADRGRRLAAAFEARLDALRVPADGPRPLAVVYAANGYTHGQGSLVDAALEVAGFENLAARLGLTGVAQLPLEALLVAAPDVLILGVASEAWPALAGQILDHPALDDAFPESVRMILPESLWNCGTPVITAAIRRLARLRERVLRQAAAGRE